jgi:hypothetical protein
MSSSEAMTGNVTVALLEHVAHDEGVSRSTQAASWDPFEVWLTRIKQPRDRAAKSAPAGTSNGIRQRHD